MCDPFLTVTYSGKDVSTQRVMLVESAHRLGYSPLVVLPLGPRENYFMKVERLRTVIRERAHCPDSLVLVSDAYDAFMTSRRQLMVERFLQLNTGILWSAERLYSWQNESWKSYYESVAPEACVHRYLNTGGFLGYVRALLPLLEETHFVSRYLGADQMAYSKQLATRGLAHWNASLDYGSRVFYCATGLDWSLQRARARVLSASPCHVHMPFSKDPRNNATLHALSREFGASRPRLPPGKLISPAPPALGRRRTQSLPSNASQRSDSLVAVGQRLAPVTDHSGVPSTTDVWRSGVHTALSCLRSLVRMVRVQH